MGNYLQITIESDGPRQEILIALLSENGFDGFQEDGDQLMAFIPEKEFGQIKLDEILSGLSLSYSKKIIGERNWNDEWEKNFEPVRVGNFCGIRASFHPAIKNVAHMIIITPKMSFGTGHHSTTYQMIESMQKIEFKDRWVLDFGTGTGILAILAEKLGAEKIIAIDNDEWCIENAKENIISNACRKVTILPGNSVPLIGQRFGIILANLNRNIIMEQLPLFRQQLSPGGVLLVSGLLAADSDELVRQLQNYNLYIASKSLKDSWICLKLFSKSESGDKERAGNS